MTFTFIMHLKKKRLLPVAANLAGKWIDEQEGWAEFFQHENPWYVCVNVDKVLGDG